MTEARFPKKRDDGSFTVLALFSTSDENVVPLVRAYVEAWVRANQTWTRIWRSNCIEVERLEFSSEFASEPRVEDGNEKLRFAIVFDGRPSALRWKDWIAFLLDELRRVFHEIKFEGFES
ncbi:MAG: hypothetical protein ACOY0T_28460 [Myxococcota bacterium]